MAVSPKIVNGVVDIAGNEVFALRLGTLRILLSSPHTVQKAFHGVPESGGFAGQRFG